MISFFVPIAEALIFGYVAAVAVYMLLLLVVTRLGHRVLMRGNCASGTYSLLNTCAWAAAALVGAYLCCGMSPLAPYGAIGFPLVLAILLGLVAVRNFRQLPGQISIIALIAILAGILVGTLGALYFRHAFAALHA